MRINKYAPSVFTLNDLFKYVTNMDLEIFASKIDTCEPIKYGIVGQTPINLFRFVLEEFYAQNYSTDTVIASDESNLIWTYILQKYQDFGVAYYYEPISEDEKYDICRSFFRKYLNILKINYKEYIEIFDAYIKNKSKDDFFTGRIEDNIVKFNDTPQTAQGSTYDFTTDNYLTNVTSAHTEKDEELAMHMNNIKTYYFNYMEAFVNKFSKLFIY